MIDHEQYIQSLIELLQAGFRERLLYVGLQGSYLRGEATEHSDIDIMVVIKDMTPADLTVYRRAIESLECCEKSCGFICGENELRHWNPLEICHLLHTTRDFLGVLSDLTPEYTKNDVRSFVKMSLGNLYHEICHRYIHSSEDNNRAKLPGTYRSVFFILQNLHCLESGHFALTKQELMDRLSGMDRAVLEAAIMLNSETEYDFDEMFALLFEWCAQTMARA